jgi:hypothetical protein
VKHLQNLFIAQDIAMFQKLKVLYRHTVDAAKVATVCYRDPEIGDLTIVVVYVSRHMGMPP